VGGFTHVLHCDSCGEAKTIPFDEIWELHLQFLKGLEGPYSVASAEYDDYVQKYAPVEPISKTNITKG
jgi:hypothetical protein